MINFFLHTRQAYSLLPMCNGTEHGGNFTIYTFLRGAGIVDM